MKSLRVLACLFCLAAASRAEETLDELKARLNATTDAWKGFSPGTWVELKHWPLGVAQPMPVEQRQTLVARDEKSVTIEIRIVTRKANADGTVSVEFGAPQTIVQPIGGEGSGWTELKDLRREDLTIGGRKVACRVVEATRVVKLPAPRDGKTDETKKTTLWICEEMKEMGGLVQTKGGMPATAATGGLSYDIRVTEMSGTAKIGKATVATYSYEYISIPAPGMPTVFGEVQMSPEVPNRLVSLRFGMSEPGPGNKEVRKPKLEVTEEALDMDIVKSK